ncbi:MAG: putative hydrolase superfamily [Acidimicrobiales bacterium]|nr:putative hydrolase superfamily [Acidimicrobiales bacterium]
MIDHDRRVSRRAIGAVFFDFAGTLFDDRALRGVHLHQLRFVAAAAGVPASDDQLRAAYREGMSAAYRTVASRRSYRHRELFGAAFTAMADALGGTIGEATAQEAVDRQYRATIDAAVLRPDCLSTVEALRAASIHVQIVSNIDDEQLDPMLDRLGLRKVIDAATSSQEAGSCKPDPAIYWMALAKAGIEPSQGLFVGDSVRHDVEGPASIGMPTAWLAPAGADPGDGHPGVVIHALGDVLDIVGVGVRR